ncbi:hypothetical protein NDU88_006897 [Pleurodeles waltl]|uniref:Uncharacterized protein n=1 Tax=Pleurodeles waltl TaxID=8319 RepID=A0AAV7NTA8_PLEWA|nr:hypothetical protein NDU88_006897 [Pleurodeles waltl]
MNRWLGGAVRLGTTAPSWNPPLDSAGDRGRSEGPLTGGLASAGGERRGPPANESGITTWPRRRGEPGRPTPRDRRDGGGEGGTMLL